jgi:hypothetical protein
MNFEATASNTAQILQNSSSTFNHATSFVDQNGVVKALPRHADQHVPIKLTSVGCFEIEAETLFLQNRLLELTARTHFRYAVTVRFAGRQICRWRYRSDEVALGTAVDIARRWIKHHRHSCRLRYLVSPPLIAIWAFCIGAAWFLEPLIGVLSLAPLFLSIPIGWLSAPPIRNTRQSSAVLGGLRWDRNDFCRGWLITGDTGAGKTFAINRLLHSVFQHEQDWGGLCCDEKGIYHETLSAMVRKYGREDDLVLLQTRPDGAEEDWVPPAKFNLLSDPAVPWSTYATAIVDTASSLAGGSHDKGFFKTQAHANIGRGIQLLRLLKLTPSMHHLLEMLQYQPVLKAMLQQLESLKKQGNADASDCYEHFQNGYLRQPPEQLGGVISTIYNYLNYFTNPDIVEVFGAEENTFDLSGLDQGAIVCISLPQKYQTERRYITTLLKMLFYTHALRRFDPRPAGKRPMSEDNLLICWQDEAQRFITESDGNVDMIRQARTTTVLAAQSKLSFLPALGSRDKADVTILNLRNRIIFKAADRTCAEGSSDFIGKRMNWKKTYTRSRGSVSVTRVHEEEFLVKPYELMGLPKFTAIVKHCEKRYKRMTMHPIEPEGSTPDWYPLWKRFWT